MAKNIKIQTQDKPLINELINQKKLKLAPEELRELLIDLNERISFRQLSYLTGIPHTTLFHMIKQKTKTTHPKRPYCKHKKSLKNNPNFKKK